MKNKSKPRKKNIPQYFQRKKSASLSQLLKIASYKKRINDLVRNNRRLAVELQDSRCEVSSQSKILREYYTRDSNNIMRAQLKIRDMVKTINTLVCDIDEVKKYLDIDWTAIKGKLMQNRYTSDSKIIKVPEFEGIEEVSMSASEPPVLSPEEIPSSSHFSQLITERISLHKSYDQEAILSDSNESAPPNGTNCVQRSNEVTPTLVENEMPAVLFVEESGDQNKKDKRSTKSTKDGPLTPEFDIDFTFYNCKKSSSRRRTLFRSSNNKKSKSSERVASHEPADPFEMECETRPTDGSIIQENKISQSPHAKSKKQSGNCKSLSDSSPGTSCSSKNLANCINDQFTSVAVLSLENASSVPPKIEVVPQPVEYNNTLLLNEDMELTDVVNSCNPILVGNNVSTAGNPGIDQRVISHTCAEDVKSEIDKKENVNIKEVFKINEENTGISTADEQQTFSAKEIPFQEGITTSQNSKGNRKSVQRDSTSPLHGVRSCRRNVMKYLIFSSDSSDSDYTPSKPTVKKRKCNDRETAIFVGDAASKKTVTENTEDFFNQQKYSLQNGKKIKSDDLSVFNFNASFSEKPDGRVKQKKSKLSRNKNSGKGKEVPVKSLSQTCNVTKLNGFTLKFSKSEYIDKKNKPENNVPKRPEVPSGSESSTSSSSGMEKEILIIENNVNKEKSPSSDKNTPKDEIPTENKCNTSFTDFGSLLSPRTILKNRNLNQCKKSEAKRVSFNASDLVCNFTKKSLSKTIASNTKVWQTSKSVVDLEEILPPFEKHGRCQEMPHDDILSERNASGASVNAQESLYDYAGETEIYKFSCILTDDDSPAFAEVGGLSFSQKTVSSSNELQNNKFVPYHGEHNSDKTDVLIENTNKINTISRGRKDILSQKNVVKKKSSKDQKSIQLKSVTSTLKIKNHIQTSQKKHHSSSKENIKSNPKINKASKHRNSKILEMLSFNDSCLNEVTVDNSYLSDKSSKVSVDKDTMPEKDKILSSGKGKKSNSGKKCVQSTPVLTDTKNLDSSFSLTPKTSPIKPQTKEPLESEIPQELPRRRSKPVCYKEPHLNTKMRRNT